MANGPLIRFAAARSGDKGDDVNIGAIVRDPAHYPWLCATLARERVAARFAHLLVGGMERLVTSGLRALSFVLHHALADVGAASLRSDPLGMACPQILPDLPMPAPEAWTQPGLEHEVEGVLP